MDFVNDSVDSFVKFMAPHKKKAIPSVKPWLIALFCLPMVIFTDTNNLLQVRATILLLFNIVVRLLYPSCYYPATASVAAWYASPVTARSIAFIAEFALYEVWAVWAGLDFWGDGTYLWVIVLFGEIVSTSGVVLQSEALLNIEDTTWSIHAVYQCYLAFPQLAPTLYFGGFSSYMFLVHLPRRFGLMFHRGLKGLFHMYPLFISLDSKTKPNEVKIQPCPFEEKAWVVPMLLGQPILTAIMYATINSRGVTV